MSRRSLPPVITGILLLASGLAVFSVQDVILKLLSGGYPLHQAMVLRSVTALPMILLIVRFYDGRLSTILSRAWPLMLLRGLLNVLSYLFFYLGLAALPLPTTMALFFTGPLFITLASALLLRERVPPTAILAVLTGFCGVMMIVQPGRDGTGLVALLPVAGAFCYALSMVAARVIGQRESAAAMAFWSNLSFLLCAALLSLIFGTGQFTTSADQPALSFLTRGWTLPSPGDFALLGLCGLIAAVGLTLITEAYRIAPASKVAPFEYSVIFWGLLWGWLFWDHLPDALAWGGIALLITAGIFLLREDRRASEAQPGDQAQQQA